MAGKFKTFLKSIKSLVSKYDVETDLNSSLDYLDEVISMYERTSEVSQDGTFNNPENEKLVKAFYVKMRPHVPSGVVLTVNGRLPIDMIKLLRNVRENGEFIKLRLRNYKMNTISPTAMTIETATILRAVPQYHFIARYAADLINILVSNGIKGISQVDSDIPKFVVDNVNKNMGIFVSLLHGYARNNKDFVRVIEELPGEVLTADENARVDHFINEASYDLVPGVPNGFIGSPIFTIRSIIAQWQADRYHEAEDMKNLYQLRLNYYKSLADADGNVDSSVEKEISFLQRKVNALSVKIDKMEKSIQ